MKKSVISRNGNISSQLDEFLGRPPLLKGEDRVNYRKLRKSVAEVMDPENLLEAIEVQEVVDSIWEARRFQKLGTKLVDAECLKALKYLSSSMYGYITETADDWLESLEGKPYPDGMTKADVLKKAGLSEGLVQARAVLFAAEEFAVLDDLVASRVAARKASLKDYERRKRLSAKEKRAAAETEGQSRDLANDNRPAVREVRTRTKRTSSW